MSIFNSIQTPQSMNLLLAIFDVRNYTRLSLKMESSKCFQNLNILSEFAGSLLESKGGKIIKFMGDSGLVVFPETEIDKGIQALLEFQQLVKKQLKETGFDQIDINCHFGEVCIGLFGPKSNKQLDILGPTVNALFTMNRHPGKGNFFMTPQVFRKLGKDNRKAFHKFTPPIVYIGNN